MTSRVTISIEPEVKRKLNILAKRKQRTVSRYINELISEDAKKEKVIAAKSGLGSYLVNLTLKEIPKDFKNDKELLGRLKDDKHYKR